MYVFEIKWPHAAADQTNFFKVSTANYENVL